MLSNQLINANANLEVKDSQGDTALGTAIRVGSVDTILMLIDAGADIEAPKHFSEIGLLRCNA